MTALLREEKPSRRSRMWLRQVNGENAVYDPRTGAIHLLNETALAIWQLCDGETSPEEMVVAICELCRVHREIAVEDVTRTLDEFDRASLIKWRDA
jgi:PqqD family protein of HPr-rel-A system